MTDLNGAEDGAQHDDTDHRNIDFTYDSQELINLAFKTSILTFLTLGIYRFWAKTQIRQRLWGSVRIDGDPLEYTGTGLEKFLGFLVAIVVLAIYLGILNLGLTFTGMTFFFEAETDEEQLMQFGFLMINIIALLPLILFAMYRARRYKMARTLWRGIRFGMDDGAGGFVGKALIMSVVNTVTLGLLSPWRRFALEKYMTDRSYFGTLRFAQGGAWTKMYGAMKYVVICYILIMIAGVFGVIAGASDQDWLFVITGIAIFIAYFLIYAGVLYYSIRSTIYLLGTKTLGTASVHIDAQRTHVTTLLPDGGTYEKSVGKLHRRVFWRIVLGYLGAFMIGSVAMAILGGIGLAIGFAFDNEVVMVALAVLGYVSGLVFIEALTLILVMFPVAQLYVSHLRIDGFSAVMAATQRAADSGADAEGFADALDIGGAF